MVLVTRTIVLLLFTLLGCSTASAQSIESVAAEHIAKEYCLGVQSDQVVFAKDAIHYHGSYALLESPAYLDNGAPTDGLMVDLVFVLCLEKQDQWRVVYDLTRSDVPSVGELDSMKKTFPVRFPKSLLPQFWQRLLK